MIITKENINNAFKNELELFYEYSSTVNSVKLNTMGNIDSLIKLRNNVLYYTAGTSTQYKLVRGRGAIGYKIPLIIYLDFSYLPL